jgi:thioredoxin-related protein/sulfur relay (sulfurtransferase) DsrC/TusE family protein
MLQLNTFFEKFDSINCGRKMTLTVVCVSWLFVFTAAKGFAQSNAGIKFERGLSWSEILEKARKENKFIFLDGYTTWCAPCLQMAKDIFPKQEVGEFFNHNFINVAVQFDVTSSDDAEVKSWYEDAKKISEAYKISSYPTYLYFSPQGNLIHALKGGTVDAEEFIEKSKFALDPKTQYATLKWQYHNGYRDSAFLANIITMAFSVGDQDSLKYYAQDYLKLQKDLFQPDNVKLIAATTKKSSDIGFPVLRNHPELVDSVLGKGVSKAIVKRIVSDEIIRPLTRLNLTITEYYRGMVVYGGTIIPNVDWELVKKRLDADYSDISAEMLRQAKLEHFQELKDWKQYALVMETWRKHHIGGSIDHAELDNYLRAIYEQCTDENVLRSALKWAKQNTKADKSNLSYLLIYNKLLYKNGKHKAAIKNMKSFVETDSAYRSDAIDILNKMQLNAIN